MSTRGEYTSSFKAFLTTQQRYFSFGDTAEWRDFHYARKSIASVRYFHTLMAVPWRAIYERMKRNYYDYFILSVYSHKSFIYHPSTRQVWSFPPLSTRPS